MTGRARVRDGRAARLARLQDRGSTPAYITRNIPRYELLNEEELQKLEAHADWILQEIGIEFRGDEVALRLFKEAGATVDGERVRFDKGHVGALCATAPREFKSRIGGLDQSISSELRGCADFPFISAVGS